MIIFPLNHLHLLGYVWGVSCLIAAGVIEGPWDLNHMEGPKVIRQSQEMQLGCKHIKGWGTLRLNMFEVIMNFL